ncbi:MAG: hypothetical protein GX593_12245 [Actinomycetales bacterium]|nr:hypothetical protein [Actinomycetales bacterium]
MLAGAAVLVVAGCSEPAPAWTVETGFSTDECSRSSLTITSPVTTGLEELAAWSIHQRREDGSMDRRVVRLVDSEAYITGDASTLRPVGAIMLALEGAQLPGGGPWPRIWVGEPFGVDDLAPELDAEHSRVTAVEHGVRYSVEFSIRCGEMELTGELHAYEQSSSAAGPCGLLDADDDEIELRTRVCEGDLAALLPTGGTA